jgi:transposase
MRQGSPLVVFGGGREMYGVELYREVRLAVFDEGLTHRKAALRFGIDRRTVKKMLSYSAPPGYRRSKPAPRPKLDAFTGIVDAILTADRDVPRKQRHTAQRIFERLRDEHGFAGGYTIVKDYVRERHLSTREAFVPLHHPPGHAQVDFGQAVVELQGERQKVHFFCMILPHSNAWFVKAYRRETTEAFLDGHVSAFAFFGGVPRSILYDNTTLAVARILGDGERQRTQAFSHLQSHYLFRDRFGRPGKGKVEALVKTARRKFFVPIPRVVDLDALNEQLLAGCLARLDALEGGETAVALMADLEALRDLPAVPFEACEQRAGRVSSTALVRYRLVDYSVPVAYAHREVMIKGYVDRVEIACGQEVVARHRRSYERGAVVYEPLHYLALLEKKPGALEQAAPLKGWKLDPAYAELCRLLEARFGHCGKREYIQVLRLLEDFPEPQVTAAVREAVKRRLVGFDAVKHLLLARIERRPAYLDLSQYPHLPQPFVAATRIADYGALLAGGAAHG